MWEPTIRPSKHIARQIAIANIPSNPKNIVLLPGKDMEDLKEAQNQHKLLDNTNVILVEKNYDIQTIISQNYKDIHKNCKLWKGDLFELIIENPVDYIFIDLIGPLSANLCYWIFYHLIPNLSTKSTVVISMLKAYRGVNYGFPQYMDKIIKKRHSLLSQTILNYMLHEEQVNQRVHKDITGVMMTLIKMMFCDCQAEFLIPYEYSDTSKMLMFIIKNIRYEHNKISHEQFAKILKNYESESVKIGIKNSMRSKKANQSRSKKMRKLIAKKAAETRKKNLLCKII